MQVYLIPKETAENEVIVKNSRFIAFAFHVSSKQDVKSNLLFLKSKYPDARHYCWAYVLGSPDAASHAGMNDDGEPSGTAGKPIFNVIQHKKIGDVLVVVVRYFGGIKLGAAGLLRAYSQAAEKVLAKTSLVEIRPKVTVHVQADFAREQAIRHFLQNHGGEMLEIVYAENVSVKISLDHEFLEEFSQFCRQNSIVIKDKKPS